MDINFELYKIFYHAAKSESFSEAGAKLFISQSAVSQAIKNLEDKMGTKLFFRKTRNIHLTHEGEMLYKHVEQAYNFLKAAENKISEMQSLNSGEVRIGVSDTICKYFLVPYLEKFNVKYPRIKIKVINRTSSQIETILKNGQIDFGVVTLPITDKTIESTEFLSVEDIFVASAKYKSLLGKRIKLKELSSYPLLMLQKGSATRRNVDAYLKQKGIEITPEIELESIDLLVEFARIGLGIAHVLKESAVTHIENGDLFEIKTDEKMPERKLGIITMKDVPLSGASSEFVKFLY